MKISRRLRFEILRRDNHTCRYCGASAPDVPLRVDHVIPVALGGGDDPTNLVTACQDCNAGKSSVPLDAPTVAQVREDALRWSRALEYAAAQRRARRDNLAGAVGDFNKEWSRYRVEADNYTPVPRPDDWENSVLTWFERGAELDDLVNLVPVVMARENVATENVWRYYCGCVWRMFDEIEAEARAQIETSSV